jgi:hypothetical protein
MENLEGLTQSLGNAVGEMLAHGFQLPLRFALIAGNGCMMIGVYEPSADADRLEGNVIGTFVPEGEEGFRPPMNIMFVDPRGEATRVVFTADSIEHVN